MRTALRTLLCLTVAFGLFWSANAQAAPSDAPGRSRDARGPSIMLSARAAITDYIISHRANREGGDACESSLWGCIRSGRVEREVVSAPGLQRGWSGRVTLRAIPQGHIEPVHIRPRPTLSNPIPEPQAALVFMAGIGIAAARIRRS